jgi:hypothetical protein
MQPWSQPLLWGHAAGGPKVYYEATFANMPASGSWGVGVTKATQVLNAINSTGAAIGSALQFMSQTNSTCVINNGGNLYNLGASANNDIVCVAVDRSNNNIWFRKNGGNWNNSGTANPATNTGGFSLTAVAAIGVPVFAVATSSNFTAPTITANFGASAFSFAIPSGFQAWGSTTTWNPADKSTNAVLSGGNLIFGMSAGTNEGVRGTDGR